MDGQQTMVLNDGIIVNKEIPVILKRAAAKIRISLNYVNGYTPLENNIPYKKLMNYAADGAAIAQGTLVVSDLQSMSSFTEQNTGAGYNGQIILYSYANDWTKDTNRETYVLINVPVKNAEGTTTTQNYYRIPVNYRLPNGSTGQTESLYKLERNHLYDIQVKHRQEGDTVRIPPSSHGCRIHHTGLDNSRNTGINRGYQLYLRKRHQDINAEQYPVHHDFPVVNARCGNQQDYRKRSDGCQRR